MNEDDSKGQQGRATIIARNRYYHQNISKVNNFIERTSFCLRMDRRTPRRTDARLIAISPSDKKGHYILANDIPFSNLYSLIIFGLYLNMLSLNSSNSYRSETKSVTSQYRIEKRRRYVSNLLCPASIVRKKTQRTKYV